MSSKSKWDDDLSSRGKWFLIITAVALFAGIGVSIYLYVEEVNARFAQHNENAKLRQRAVSVEKAYAQSAKPSVLITKDSQVFTCGEVLDELLACRAEATANENALQTLAPCVDEACIALRALYFMKKDKLKKIELLLQRWYRDKGC